MGHTCANLNGELFFIWGGANDNLSSTSRADSQLWIYETLTGYWRRRECTGECPPHLSGSTCSLIGRKMYVFGGHSSAQDNWLNNLFCLDLDTFEWKDLGSKIRAEPTKPIRCDKCSSWTFNGRFYIFGGYGWSQIEHLSQLHDRQKDLQLVADHRWPKFGWNNQLVEFDPRENTWRWPSYAGKCPSARAAHSGAMMESKYYLFGGRNSQERLNDLYSFDMHTFEWTRIAIIEDQIGPISSTSLIVHGSNLPFDFSDSAEQNNRTSELDERNIEPHSVMEIDDDDGDVLNSSDDESDRFSRAQGVAPHQLDIPLDPNNSSHEEGDISDRLECANQRWSLGSLELPETSNSSLDCSVEAVEVHDLGDNSADDEESADPRAAIIDWPSRDQDLDQLDHQLLDQRFVDESPNVPQESTTQNNLMIQTQASVPLARSFCSFTPISSNDIVLYGGISKQDKILDDCWIFDIERTRWTQLDLKHKRPRLWHSAARTRNRELVIIGGSCSVKVDEFCSEVLTISSEPKSLKRLSLDSVARSIRIKSVMESRSLPSTIGKLIRLRKQAIALTMRRPQRPSTQLT